MSQIRTTFRLILLRMRAMIATSASLDETRVMITVLEPHEVPHVGAARDVLLRPRDEIPDVAVIDGAGRYDNRRTRRVDVTARTRLLLDPAGLDLARLTDESLGHIELEDAVCEALELMFVESGSDTLTVAPMRATSLAGPRRGRSGDGKEGGWVYSTWSVDVPYMRDLTLGVS